MNRIFALLLVVFFASCGNTNNKEQKESKTEGKNTVEPLNIKLFKVPRELNEISGISFIDDHTVVAIQDEEGILYFYDLNKEAVVRTYEFWKGKDYEDLAVVGNDLFIVNSSGAIYELKNFRQGPSKPLVHKTVLKEENNIEGLAYDKKNNRLLLAVKDLSLDGDESKKDIYAFNLTTKKLDTTAAYTIRLSEVETYFKGDQLEETSKKLLKAIGNQNLNEVFRTSALNLNPATGELYVLSSMNNIIAVLDSRSKITRILELDGKEFIQPEGLAFNPAGKLFVSNEGKKKQANIIEVTYAK